MREDMKILTSDQAILGERDPPEYFCYVGGAKRFVSQDTKIGRISKFLSYYGSLIHPKIPFIERSTGPALWHFLQTPATNLSRASLSYLSPSHQTLFGLIRLLDSRLQDQVSPYQPTMTKGCGISHDVQTIQRSSDHSNQSSYPPLFGSMDPIIAHG